jgi:hypothetical protein
VWWLLRHDLMQVLNIFMQHVIYFSDYCMAIVFTHDMSCSLASWCINNMHHNGFKNFLHLEDRNFEILCVQNSSRGFYDCHRFICN